MSSTFLGNEKEETKLFLKPEYFKNRELSWMDFNDRVLEEARNKDNPLLERINFLGITQSNVDEFFMVRVASLHKLIAAGIKTTDSSGQTPEKQLDAINQKEHRAVEKDTQLIGVHFYHCLKRRIFSLKKSKI